MIAAPATATIPEAVPTDVLGNQFSHQFKPTVDGLQSQLDELWWVIDAREFVFFVPSCV